MKKIVQEGVAICKRNAFWVIASVLCMFLAYGFFATNYTYHIDQLAQNYYDGDLLVTAGRFTAPVIHFFTNWMFFSPFWHTVIMCVLLFCAGIAWSVLFARASGGALTDSSLFVFLLTFVTFPVINYQLTFPLLNIALAYLLVPLALCLLGEQELKHRVIGFALLTLAVDCYESFAAVYLIGLFAILLLSYLFVDPDRSFQQMCKQVLIACAYLLAAILVDFALSKLLCFLVSGSFAFWYDGNTVIGWLEMGIVDSLIWLVRTVIGYYIIGHVQNAAAFLLLLSCVAGLVGSIVLAVRRKKPLIPVLYLGLVISVFSLCIVLGMGVDLHSMQGVAVFSPFVFMLVWQFCGIKKHARTVAAVLLCLVCMVQTQSINSYTLENYERYTYETAFLQRIAISLESHETQEKPTAIVLCGQFELPDAFKLRQPTHPVARGYRAVWYRICDAVFSESYFEKMGGWYGAEVANTEDLVLAITARNANKKSFVGRRIEANMQTFEVYNAMQRLGVTLVPCTKEQHATAAAAAAEQVFAAGERYRIVETEDLIVVYVAGTENG